MKSLFVGVGLLAMSIGFVAQADPYKDAVQAYKQQNYDAAFAGFLPLADQGDSGAQYNLGIMYANGRGVEKSLSTAASWYGEAARKGHKGAQYNLGVMYRDALGIEQSHVQAKDLFEKAAARGHLNAMYSLGQLYENGQGVDQNRAMARSWYEKAAQQNHSASLYNLGVYAFNGWGGLDPSPTAALGWFKKSAAAGNKQALAMIEALSGITE